MADAEIEHQTPVRPIAKRFGEGPHLFDKPGLADPGFAANIDDASGPPGARGIEQASELVELRLASDEDAAVSARHRLGRDSDQPKRRDRLVDALEAQVSQRLTNPSRAQQTKDAAGQQGLSGSCGGHESGRKVHRVPKHRVVVTVGTGEDARHDLAAGDPDMGLQLASG